MVKRRNLRVEVNEHIPHCDRAAPRHRFAAFIVNLLRIQTLNRLLGVGKRNCISDGV